MTKSTTGQPVFKAAEDAEMIISPIQPYFISQFQNTDLKKKEQRIESIWER